MDKTATEIRDKFKHREMLKRKKKIKELEYNIIISSCKVTSIQELKFRLRNMGGYYNLMMYNPDGTERSNERILSDLFKTIKSVKNEIIDLDCKLLLLDIGEKD